MDLIVGAYTVDTTQIRKALLKLGAKRLLIQSPLGLRAVATELAKTLEAEGYSVLLSNSACWGACDVAYQEAENLEADAIIHLGHTKFMKHDKIPTIYIPCHYWNPAPLINLIPRISNVLNDAGARRIGLGASIQWNIHLELVKTELKKSGIEALTHEPKMFAVEEAQVLGCDYTALKPLEDKVDAFVVVGSVFHALGMALVSDKPTYAIDPAAQSIRELTENKRRIINQRYANIMKFKEAERIGIIVSTKPGQKRINIVNPIARILQNHGKEVYVISADEVNEQLIIEYGLDAYVNTACPRLSIEDQVRFSRPLLLPAEVLVAVGILEWSFLVEKGLIMFPWAYSDENSKTVWRLIAGEAYGRRQVSQYEV